MEQLYSIDVFYSGKVQGVGFRYQTVQVAREFAVTGEVRNLIDGRVFLSAEGAEAEVEAFRAELEARLHNFIRNSEVTSGCRQPKYSTFSIT